MTHNDLTNFDYWDTLYNDEYLEYKENHILGEEWYEPQCDAILEHLLNLFSEKNISILDVGCGNGLFLKRLAESGFCNLTGCDYSEKALLVANAIFVDLVKEITQQKLQISLVLTDLRDIKQHLDFSTLKKDMDKPCFLTSFFVNEPKFNLVIDKGTFDVFFMVGNVVTYMKTICSFLTHSSFLCITTCNATREELLNCFLHPTETILWKFHLNSEIDHPSYVFHGQKGNVVTTLIFSCS